MKFFKRLYWRIRNHFGWYDPVIRNPHSGKVWMSKADQEIAYKALMGLDPKFLIPSSWDDPLLQKKV